MLPPESELRTELKPKMPAKGQLLKIIEESERLGLLSEKDRQKLTLCFPLWGVHAVLSNLGFVLGPASAAMVASTENPLALGLNLLPSALRLGSILATEKLFKVKFSRLSKAIAFWPFVGGGSAMPVEIASTLGLSYTKTIPEKMKDLHLPFP